MSGELSQLRPWRRRLVSWGPFVLIAVLGTVCWTLDRHFKSTDGAGIVPPDATWRIGAEDLPRFWRQWEGLAATQSLRAAAPPFMEDAAVAVRKATGVRPTPARVRLWLGQSALLAGTDSAWCLSARPGLAMRLATALHGLAAAPSGLRTWGGLAYGWRDGYLLISPSGEYLSDVIEGGTVLPRAGTAPEAVALTWGGERPGALRIHAREGLPFDMELPAPAGLADGDLHYGAAWPEALAVVNVRGADGSGALLEALAQLAGPAVPHQLREVWDAAATAWWSAQIPPHLPEDCGGESAWVLFAPGPGEDALRFGQVRVGCGPEVAAATGAVARARPYRWDDREGWLVISERHRAPLALGVDGERLAWANDPMVVPALLDGDGGVASPGSVHVRVHWEDAARLGKSVLRNLGEANLLPRLNGNEMTGGWQPYLDGLASWNQFVATGVTADGKLDIQGQLAAPDME